MSKRARRQRTPNLPPEAFNVPAARTDPAPTANTASTAPAAAPATAAANRKSFTVPVVNWQLEYGEVLGDLRRTFIIFAALVIAMVALSFVIR